MFQTIHSCRRTKNTSLKKFKRNENLLLTNGFFQFYLVFILFQKMQILNSFKPRCRHVTATLAKQILIFQISDVCFFTVFMASILGQSYKKKWGFFICLEVLNNFEYDFVLYLMQFISVVFLSCFCCITTCLKYKCNFKFNLND